jgi:SAM-dependent methyltransferase
MTTPLPPAETKTCCAQAYESEWARLLLGDSFHPGGVDLTLHLGRRLGLRPGVAVLDVACGRGTSAIALAHEFGCAVHGVDLSAPNIEAAHAAAKEAGLSHLVSFEAGDAEQLPFEDATYDAVFCECAFCTFPSKDAAAAEFARVLRPGGRLGLSDITRNGDVPPELDSLLGWVACIADARSANEYAAILAQHGFTGIDSEGHDGALAALAKRARFKLLGAEILAKLGKGPFELAEIAEAKRIVKVATRTIAAGNLGYTLITGRKAVAAT